MELGKPGLLGCYEKIRCLHGLGCKVGSSRPVCKGGRLSLAARRRRGNSEPGRASVCFSLPADQGIRRRLVSKFLVPQGGQAGTSRATRLLPVKKTPSWWPMVKVSQRNTQHLRRVPRPNRTWQEGGGPAPEDSRGPQEDMDSAWRLVFPGRHRSEHHGPARTCLSAR